METIFTKIINGTIPSYKIAEDEFFYAFLDINPLAEGHTLVVPKLAVDYIFDIEDQLLGNMMIFAKKIAIAIEKNIRCKRIGITVIGLEVPHAHIHLVPINDIYDIDFQKEKLKLSADRFAEIARMIANTVQL
ncbi:MAG: HIT family protein [Bacteroidales bacterium]|jgi:histidine triad (HIT) family protein|nr:HIT family protein [Bacteroidales bacterium]